MTETYATLQMSAQIGPDQCESLRCKVNTSAGGNVMPLHTFAKLSPACTRTDDRPLGLHTSNTDLTVYN